MTTIKVTCKFSDCKTECDIDADDVLLVLREDDANQNYYSFVCDTCKRYNRKHADEEIITLIEPYVRVTTMSAPSTGYCTCSKPITEHDIQCFAFDLADNALTGAHIQEELEE